MKHKYYRMIVIWCCMALFSLPVGAAEIQTVYQLDGQASVAQHMGAQKPVPHAMAKGAAVVSSESEYRLGAGDKIKVFVFGEADMTVEVRLGASGDMRYPFLGKIHVAGMTLPELQREISSELSRGYLVDPQVRVSIEEFRSFYVNGEVKNPGGYPFQPGLTVRKAISLAGGFTENADRNKLFLIHASDEKRHESKVALDQEMGPDDTLTVKKSFVFVSGEVKRPGKYVYKPDMTYRLAVSMAGGLTENADEHKLFLIHDEGGVKHESKASLDQRVEPNDILTVKQSFFFVNGEVKLPGKYSYKQGMTYRMAISMAGGIKDTSSDDKIYVIHQSADRKTHHVDNLDAEMKPGDVITAKEGFF